jgi:hypothetical protein
MARVQFTTIGFEVYATDRTETAFSAEYINGEPLLAASYQRGNWEVEIATAWGKTFRLEPDGRTVGRILRSLGIKPAPVLRKARRIWDKRWVEWAEDTD